MRTAKQMEKKYTKKIEQVINHQNAYTMEQVKSWWRRMYLGDMEVTGNTVTFSVNTVDRRYQMVYQRPAW